MSCSYELMASKLRSFVFIILFVKDFTGLAIAVFMAWKLIVTIATRIAVIPEITNTTQPILIL